MMIRQILFSALALTALPVGAQTPQADQRSAADSAKAFSLDLPATASPTDPTPRLPTTDTAPTGATIVAFTLDTPIGQLIADPQAKAVLDKDLPGLSEDSNLSKFQSMSLRQFQPMTGGQMSNALLAKTGADLAAITPQAATAPGPMPTPSPSPTTSRKKMDSGR